MAAFEALAPVVSTEYNVGTTGVVYVMLLKKALKMSAKNHKIWGWSEYTSWLHYQDLAWTNQA